LAVQPGLCRTGNKFRGLALSWLFNPVSAEPEKKQGCKIVDFNAFGFESSLALFTRILQDRNEFRGLE
jgi:hypothetical protein